MIDGGYAHTVRVCLAAIVLECGSTSSSCVSALSLTRSVEGFSTRGSMRILSPGRPTIRLHTLRVGSYGEVATTISPSWSGSPNRRSDLDALESLYGNCSCGC